MFASHPLKQPRLLLPWVLVIVLLAGSLLPASAAAGSGGATDTWKDMFVSSIAPRSSHTAVWTGTEMIVWGGVNGGNTGGRYNPATGTWRATTTVNAPTARDEHRAVWTGTEMIVWGGFGRDLLDMGGRYNPVTDTWTTMSVENAPAAQVYQSVVWTGSVMIVWGGKARVGDTYTYFNTGGIYNPRTDTWMPITTTGAPTPREEANAVWTGDYMVIWGGYDASGRLNSGGRYDPVANVWKSVSTENAPSIAFRSTAVWTGGSAASARMILWGSRDGENMGGRYNPASDTWDPTPMATAGAPEARNYHTAVWTGTKMIIWGGEASRGRALNSGGCYDPAANAWTPITSTGAPIGRHMHTAIWTGGTAGKAEMIVWGGKDDVAYLGEGGRYDPDKDTWAFGDGASAPSNRYDHTAVWTGGAEGEMIVWGGQYIAYPYHFNTGGRYNPRKNTWAATSITGAPEGRYAHTAVWTGGSAASAQMIVWGGKGSEGVLNTGGCYNPTTDTWTAVSTIGAPAARSEHTAVWTGTKMIIWGGKDGSGAYLNTGGVYDPASNTWESISLVGAPAARSEHTAVWTGTKMIIWGGKDGSTYFDSGAVLDPSTTADRGIGTWAAIETANAPTARSNHTAVWAGDAAGNGEMIVWGGADGSRTAFDTGGRYDPGHNTWTPISLKDATEARADHTAVWTGGATPTGEMIIWGGITSEYHYLETGARYNPATGLWTPIRLSGAPEGRCYHTSVWSGVEMIVWGGYDGSVFNTGGRYMDIYPTFIPLISLNR